MRKSSVLREMKGLPFVFLFLLFSISSGGQTAVIAHRGGAALAPENTMAAFRNAVELKADYYELDAWLSADDSLMVIHDARVNRTTNGSGQVESMTCAELRALDAGSGFGAEFKGERIPTLREALLLARDCRCATGVVIEIKSGQAKVPSAIVSMVRDLGLENRVIISGFSLEQITRAKTIAPEIPVQLFGNISESDIDKVAAIHGNWVGSGGKPDRELIEYAHKKGILFNVWTLNTEGAIRSALEVGVDAITTNKPGLAMELRETLGKTGPSVSGKAGTGGHLQIAACQFPVSGSVRENAAWIRKQIRQAAAEGAELVQFPECALSGYPGVDLESLEDYPWDSLNMYTREIMALARDLHVWVLLGSLHPLGDGLKPLNCVYVINDSGQIADRYDKRFCTKGDLEYMSAGDHFVTFDLKGIRCGVLICFDIRFPELYREYCRMGADCIFQSFYNARQKPGGIHPKIMPVTAQAHAGINHFYMSLSNSSAPSSWPCRFITPDGLIAGTLEPDKPGILRAEVNLDVPYYDASKGIREKALQGELSSEKSPSHPRNKDRTSL